MRPNIDNFIKSKLEEVSSKFPNVGFLYEYSARYEVHLLQVEPMKELDSGRLINQLLNLESDFIDLFPFDTIYIVREGSRLKVTNPTLIRYSYTPPSEKFFSMPKSFSNALVTISLNPSSTSPGDILSGEMDNYAMAA